MGIHVYNFFFIFIVKSVRHKIYINPFIFAENKAVIISDSLTKGFSPIIRADVVTVPGANPEKILKHLRPNHDLLGKYQVIVLHIGTTWLSKKSEWELYLDHVNGKLSKEEYNQVIAELNPLQQ